MIIGGKAYNVVWYIYYVIYYRYIICWVPLNPFSLFRIYQDRTSSAIVFLVAISHIHLQYQRVTKCVFIIAATVHLRVGLPWLLLLWDELNLSLDLRMYFLHNHTMHTVQHFHLTIAIDPTTRAFTRFKHWLTASCVFCTQVYMFARITT